MKEELKKKTGSVYCRIALDRELAICTAEWIGYTGSEYLRQGMDHLLELFALHHPRLALHDLCENKGPWQNDAPWIAEHHVPMAKLLGIERTALVVSKDIFSALSARQYEQEANHDFKSFPTVEEARSWLLGGQ